MRIWLLPLIVLLYCLLVAAKPPFPFSCAMNILVILDRSDSVHGGFNKSRDFVADVSAELDVGPHMHQVALLAYSGMSYKCQEIPWGKARNNAEFLRLLRDIRQVGGTTNTGNALDHATNDLMAKRNKELATLVLVVTDGNSQDDPRAAAMRLRSLEKTWVFAASTGDPKRLDKKALYAIADSRDGVIFEDSRGNVADQTKRALKRIFSKCHTPPPTTTTTTPVPTTTTTNPVTGCETDVVIVLDFSTTTKHIFEKYKELAIRLVHSLKIGPHYTRVALVTFATVGNTETVFNLKAHETQESLVKAIQEQESIGGTSALGTGIMEALTQTREREGARPEIATRIMVVFTDGWSNKGPEPRVAAKKAMEQGFEVYACGIEKKMEGVIPLKEETLLEVATDPDHVRAADNFERIIEDVKKISERCNKNKSKSPAKKATPRAGKKTPARKRPFRG